MEFGKCQKYQLSINLFQTLIFKCTENQLCPSLLSQLCKLVILSTLGMIDYIHLSVFRTGWCLSACKNRLHLSLLSQDITKILQIWYVGYFGHTWLWPPKMMILMFRKLWCLSSSKKWILPLTSFLKYC